jgi:polysaccharide deacetylase 2 family uncharacterized protein YibQ
MAKGRSKGGGPSTLSLIIGAFAAVGLGLLLGMLLAQSSCRTSPGKPKPTPKPAPKTEPRSTEPPRPKPETEPKPSHKQEPPKPAEEPVKSGPRVALIIDDLGYMEPELVRRLCSLPIPFSVAVLPYQEHSNESADIAYEMGKEVLLHFPMEGASGKDPGPDALLYALSDAELRARAKKALWAVPHIVGTNNHMGSRLTADRAKIRVVLEEVKARKIWFLDSRTTKDTVAHTVASELGLKTAQRNVFLDDDKAYLEIEKQWNRALALAKKDGTAIVIGHIYPETVEALEKLVRRDKAEVRFVKAGEVVQ